MSRVVVFACNQVIVSDNNVNSVIYTDPVQMIDDDWISIVTDVEYLDNADANGLVYQAEVSNDGANWVNAGNPRSVTATGVELWTTITDLPSAFLRIRFEFASSVGNFGAVNFGLKAFIDHA